MTWRKMAENDLPTTSDRATVAVILGRSPSKGARSPALWNAAFAHLGIDGHMLPVDVGSSALGGLIRALEEDPAVIGGAITMPHKAAVIPHLAGIDAVATSAGAVNALARDGERLSGSNTDGVAALRSIERAFGTLDGAHVLLLGCGGAGSAVAAAIAPALGASGGLTLANRDARARDMLAERLAATSGARVERIPTWPIGGMPEAGTFDVIINATSLGSALPIEGSEGWSPARSMTPIAGAEGYPILPRAEAASITAIDLRGPLARAIETTLGWLATQQDALVFDVIYQPDRTLLLMLAELAGCRTMNGTWMNLEQAVIAFVDAVAASTGDRPDPEEVRDAMLSTSEG